MTVKFERRMSLREWEPQRSRRAPAAGFTLVELLIAASVAAIAMVVTLVGYLAVLKSGYHSEKMMVGVAQLRYANDTIAQAVRSSPRSPTVDSTGLRLIIAPDDLGYASIKDITWIDQPNGVKGSKSNQRVLKIADGAPAAATESPFLNASRPAAALSASDVSTYFKTSSAASDIDLDDLFQSGDSITIPATAYGAAVTRTINNISSNSGTKTMTLTANLGVEVPNGTRIMSSGGRRVQFEVTAAGMLRYYPDNRDLTKFRVIATDIDPSPLTDPTNPSSAVTVPFAVSQRSVTVNLQKLPRGSTAGRTVQGVQTIVFARSDPTIQ